MQIREDFYFPLQILCLKTGASNGGPCNKGIIWYFIYLRNIL
jgi:hypothetical protein